MNGLLSRHRAWLSEKFELVRESNSNNLRSMEGLRGFAVFLVFLVHWSTLAAPWLADVPVLARLSWALHAVGNVGVDIFFVLSGYLIHGSLMSREQRFIPFIARRIERIYPTLLVVMAIYVALSYAFPAERKIPEGALNAALYLAANVLLLPGVLHIPPLITVAWSLSYEFFFYLTAPLLTHVLNLRTRSPAWRTLFLLTCFVAMSAYFAWRGGPARALMFVAGALLHEWRRQSSTDPSWLRNLSMPALVLGLCMPLIANRYPELKSFKMALMALCFAWACKPLLTMPLISWGQIFCWTPMRWLGNMSYSYYLVHGLALKLSFALWAAWVPADAAWMTVAAMPFVFAFSLLPSAAMFLIVERRFSLK